MDQRKNKSKDGSWEDGEGGGGGGSSRPSLFGEKSKRTMGKKKIRHRQTVRYFEEDRWMMEGMTDLNSHGFHGFPELGEEGVEAVF